MDVVTGDGGLEAWRQDQKRSDDRKDIKDQSGNENEGSIEDESNDEGGAGVRGTTTAREVMKALPVAAWQRHQRRDTAARACLVSRCMPSIP